jgi:diacylglycerol O-acyltransferase / wax synthase
MVPIAWSMGIGCAVTSYDQSLYIGLTADREAAPDVDVLRDGMERAWIGLRTTAGLPTVRPTPEATKEEVGKEERLAVAA